MLTNRLNELKTTGIYRIKRTHRLLKDHCDLAAAIVPELTLWHLSQVYRSRPSPVNQIWPLLTFPGGLGTSPITASEVTDLPEPDSPTMPRVCPRRSAKDTSSTARTLCAIFVVGRKLNGETLNI